MLSTIALNQVSSLFLQMTPIAPRSAKRAAASDNILNALHNDPARKGAAGPGGLPMQVRAKAVEAMFSVNSLDVTALKVSLIERAGQELGVKQSDYVSTREYGAALQQAFASLQRSPNAYLVIKEIEKKLGLDEIGISLEDLINAIADPDGKGNEKLNNALEIYVHGIVDRDRYGAASGDKTPASHPLDEIGIYGR
ncbi:MAG TPA: hypothetical protein VGV39_27470 [Mesorhizobium sp.]|uniref:hypothetical protein n=1 Tax=Mesorhizobium sp. TaxID=1871066 RepID=UPI002DDDB1C4|nr:hypothetical protein [Mesorhizobium sp.]HEV2506842.1 hypothetical protein [Mesorhizobium sp.]